MLLLAEPMAVLAHDVLGVLPNQNDCSLCIGTVGLQQTSIARPFSFMSTPSMESLNLNTLAHSLPNANNLAKSEKDLLNNFKG